MSDLNITTSDARVPPKLVTARSPLALGPGEYPVVQNIRSDTNCTVVRNPDLTVNASPPTGSTGAIKGAASVTLNGTVYVVTAWEMSDTTPHTTALFYQNPTTGAYTEITNKGNAVTPDSWGGNTSGSTRFVTFANNVDFSQQSTPKKVINGTAKPTLDIMVASNGHDAPLEWNPGGGLASGLQTVWNQAIVTPPTAGSFIATPTWLAYWPVCDASMTGVKMYYTDGSTVNVTNHIKMADSTSGGSDAYFTSGSVHNAVIKLSLSTACAQGDVGTVWFDNVGAGFGGPYLNIIWEATPTVISFILSNIAIDLSPTNGPYNTPITDWKTIYKSDSTNPQLNNPPAIITIDAAAHRYCTPIPMAAVQGVFGESAADAYNLRFVWRSPNPPKAAISALILAIASATDNGGFQYNTEWTTVYSDHYTFQESPPFVEYRPTGIQQPDIIFNAGGPKGPNPTAGSPTLDSPAILMPEDNSVWYDYKLAIPNSESQSNVPGGLNGGFTHIDFYFNTAAALIADPAAVPFYLASATIWTNTTSAGSDVWHTTFGPNIPFTSDEFVGSNIYYQQDPGTPAPSDFNQSIPSAMVMFPADTRLWCCNNYYSNGAVQVRSEVKFSDRGFFTRFRSVGNPDDVNAGSRLTFDGETVVGGLTAAAAAQGATTIYIWTDQSFNALGTSGGSTFIGSGTTASTLSTRYRISTDGTNSPLSIAEFNSVLWWLTNHGEIARFDQGQLSHISYRQITNSGGLGDVVAAIPAGRLGNVVGAFIDFRYYLFVTPEGGTQNTRAYVWNEPSAGRSIYGLDAPEGQGYWESVDTVAGAERALVFYDSTQNGAGRRMFVYDSTGTTRAYQEATGTIAFDLTTRALHASEVMGKEWHRGCQYSISEIEATCTEAVGCDLLYDIYPNLGTASYQYKMGLDVQDGNQWSVKGSTNNDSTAIPGWCNTVSINGLLPGGTQIFRTQVYITTESSDGRQAS